MISCIMTKGIIGKRKKEKKRKKEEGHGEGERKRNKELTEAILV